MTLPSRNVCFLVVGLLALTAVGVQGGLALADTDGDRRASTTVAVDDDSLIEVSDSVDVWKRAALPLRARTPGATRITSVNSFVNVDEFNTGDVPLDKRHLDVYDTGDRIQLSLDPDTTGAGTGDFAGREAQLLVVNVQDGQTARNVISGGGLRSNAADLLSGENEDATYNLLDDAEGVGTFDSDGGLSAQYTPDESGVYMFAAVAVEDGDGFSVSDGAASVDGNVTVVGVDSVPVQRERADVSPDDSRVNPGQSVTFDVDANLGSEDVTHSVMLYRRPTLVGQRVTLNVDEVSRDVRPEDVTIEHSLDDVNGVGDIENDLSVMGVDISDRRVARTVELPGLLDFVATKLDTNPPGTVSTGDATLDASVTAVETDGSETQLTVETFGNWSNGPYQYVYVAEGDGPDETATATGRIQINPGGGNGPANPGGGNDDDDDDGDTGGDTDDDDGDTDSDDGDTDDGDETDGDDDTDGEDGTDEADDETDDGDQGTEPGADGDDGDDQGTDDGDGTPTPASGGEAAADPGTNAPNTTTGLGPGFGVVIATLSVIAVAVLAGRRS